MISESQCENQNTYIVLRQLRPPGYESQNHYITKRVHRTRYFAIVPASITLTLSGSPMRKIPGFNLPDDADSYQSSLVPSWRLTASETKKGV
ncbi:hypothetical protein ABKN59_009408 [Abortiporus biennis]